MNLKARSPWVEEERTPSSGLCGLRSRSVSKVTCLLLRWID
jgi:hypothetical protein